MPARTTQTALRLSDEERAILMIFGEGQYSQGLRTIIHLLKLNGKRDWIADCKVLYPDGCLRKSSQISNLENLTEYINP